jgi:hypothetical protein
LYKSTDSGNSWFEQLNSQYIIRGFGWLDSKRGFIIGDGMYETIDSGVTWQEIFELRNVGLRKFHAPLNYIGYSVGNQGLIYKYIDSSYIPVELISFSGFYENERIMLYWKTASETNNNGFKIQRRESNRQIWNNIGFVPGHGTTTEIHNYTYTDFVDEPGIYSYRLRQLDYDGSFEYSEIIEVTIFATTKFSLSQNYPNPFNSATIITYQIPSDGFVSLKVYDVLGNEINTLVEENQNAGYYSITYTANDPSSGVYFYRLTAGEYSAIRKLILLK